MAYTEYVQYTTGLTLYAKSSPLNATWATGIVTMTENGSTGEYSSAAFVDDTQYVVFIQAGGAPASSDTKTGHTIYQDVRTELGLAAADLDTQLANIPTVSEMNARTLVAASYFNPAVDTVKANLISVLGTAITETLGGYLAAAISFFFDVAVPSKTMENVGVAGTPLTQADVRTAVGLAAANLDTQLSTAQADLDIITGADGVNLKVATQASIDAIEADTNEMQADLANGGRLDLIFDATLADTAELQADWANGGRLDLLLDDIPTTAEFNARTKLAAEYFDPGADTVDANLIEIMGGTLTQTLGGYLAAGFSYFYDVAAPSKTMENVGVAGTPLTQADVRTAVGLASANLDTQLADIPTVAEFNARTLASADYFDHTTDVPTVNLTQILGTAVTETVAGYAAAGFSYYYDVVTPAKTINDVGVSGTGLSQADVRTAVGLATANLDTQLGNIPTVSEFNARTLVAADYFQPTDTVARVTLVDTVTTVSSGGGSEIYPITVKASGTPVAGVECWVSTDIAGANVVAGTEVSDDFGAAQFLLDPGTYYLWRDSSTHNFPSPVAFTVTASS